MADSKGIKAGRAYVELGDDDSKLRKGLARAADRLRTFGKSVGSIGKDMAKYGAIAMAPLLGAAKYFSSFGDSVAKMAKRTGLGTETLSELRFVASQTGTDFDNLEVAFRKMQRSIYDGSRGLSTVLDAFSDLGLTVSDLVDLSPEQQFKLIADSISKLDGASKKAGVAMTLFGRTGTNLLPMFEEGAAGIERLQQEARDLGITISAKDAKAAEEFTDEMDKMIKTTQHSTFMLGRSLAPALTDVFHRIISASKGLTSFISRHPAFVTGALKMTAAIVALGAALKVLGVISTATAAIMKGGLLAAINPYVALLAILAAGVAAVAAVLGAFRAELRETAAELRKLRKEQTEYTTTLEDNSRGLHRLRLLIAQNQHGYGLNADQMTEAASILASLTAQYGEFGITLDGTTHRLEVTAGAWERLAAAQKEMEFKRLTKELAEIDAALKATKPQLGNSEYDQATVMVELDRALERRGDIKKRLAELMPEMHLETALAVGMGDPEVLQRNRLARLQMIEDEHDRAIALIDARYDYEIGKARDAAASQATLDAMEEGRKLEIEQVVWREHLKAIEADAGRVQSIEEMKLRLRYEGLDLELRLLDLAERRAIVEAQSAGENLEKVREEFDLKRQLARQGQEMAAGISSAVSVVMNPYALRSLLGGGQPAAERTAKATEESARTLTSLYRFMVGGGGGLVVQ